MKGHRAAMGLCGAGSGLICGSWFWFAVRGLSELLGWDLVLRRVEDEDGVERGTSVLMSVAVVGRSSSM